MSTSPPPIDPRLTVLSGRLARLIAMKSEAALLMAGLLAIADEHDMLPRLLSDDMPALPISSAFLATSQSVDELISTGTQLLDDIQQERMRRSTTTTTGATATARGTAAHDGEFEHFQLEPRPAQGTPR